MTPEVLQEKFLDWQCQSRIQAFRTQNGRPNSSIAPILLDKKGNELLRIIVVISENDPVNTTKLFEHTFKRTYDPADRFDKMNKFLKYPWSLHSKTRRRNKSVKPNRKQKRSRSQTKKRGRSRKRRR